MKLTMCSPKQTCIVDAPSKLDVNIGNAFLCTYQYCFLFERQQQSANKRISSSNLLQSLYQQVGHCHTCDIWFRYCDNMTTQNLNKQETLTIDSFLTIIPSVRNILTTLFWNLEPPTRTTTPAPIWGLLVLDLRYRQVLLG